MATWLNLGVHLSITAATIFLGYKFYEYATKAPPRPRIAQQPIVDRPVPVPQPREVPPELRDDTLVRATPIAPPMVETSDAPPPIELPLYVDLPSITDDQISTLFSDVGAAEIALGTNSKSLRLAGEKIIWSKPNGDTRTVAGLRLADGNVEFRWLRNAPSEAEAPLRNSLVYLIDGSGTSYVALRSPERVAAPVIDLKTSVVRLIAKSKFLPPAEDVRFHFIGEQALPNHTREGADPASMQIRDQVMLRYEINAATRILVKKAGNVAVAELDTRYELPSGDKEPMTIHKGSRKRRQLETLLDQSLAARGAIGGLRYDYGQIESALIGARNTGTGGPVGDGYIENPAAVANKSLSIAQLQRQLAATAKAISRAEALIAEIPALEDELTALSQVSELAESLKGLPLAYRFFMVVDGHEVDLIVAEYKAAN